ncbi:MAG: winged helix-turn-helix domain-containing protein [Candidatus Woesearchaeota archaeon]
MGQPEVYDFLYNNSSGWFTVKEIAEETDMSTQSVSVALKKLRKSDQVEYRIIKTEGYKGAKRGTYAYRFKKEFQLTLFAFIE